jgi:hypothetical protein
MVFVEPIKSAVDRFGTVPEIGDIILEFGKLRPAQLPIAIGVESFEGLLGAGSRRLLSAGASREKREKDEGQSTEFHGLMIFLPAVAMFTAGTSKFPPRRNYRGKKQIESRDREVHGGEDAG